MTTDWSELKKSREEVRRIYPSIFRVPLVYATKKELMQRIVEGFKGRILDVGGADRFIGDLCEGADGVTYRSMDVDTSRLHDYHTFDDIDEKFDLIFLLDVMEHIDLAGGGELLESCHAALNRGGRIVVTIPNNLHPTALGVDATHVTSYRYHDLGAALLQCGFKDLRISRVSAKRKLHHRLMAALLRPVMRFLDMDFATGILIKAGKGGE